MASTNVRRGRGACNTMQIGRRTELRAWAWLFDQGYEVFDNVFPGGPIDVVAVHAETGVVLKIEVRTATERGARWNIEGLSARQLELGVQLLVFRPSTQEFLLFEPGVRSAGTKSSNGGENRAQAWKDANLERLRQRTDETLEQIRHELSRQAQGRPPIVPPMPGQRPRKAQAR